MKKGEWTLALATMVVVLSLAMPCGASHWDAAGDYSATANPNGQWTYGYTDWNAIWNPPYMSQLGVPTPSGWTTTGYTNLPWLSKDTANGISMKAGSRDQWGPGDLLNPAVQWKVLTDGLYRIAATYTAFPDLRNWDNNGAYEMSSVRVSQNFSSSNWSDCLASGIVESNGRTWAFDRLMNLYAGDTIEFQGAYNAATTDYVGFDSTRWWNRNVYLNAKVDLMPDDTSAWTNWNAAYDYSQDINPSWDGTWKYMFDDPHWGWPVLETCNVYDKTYGWMPWYDTLTTKPAITVGGDGVLTLKPGTGVFQTTQGVNMLWKPVVRWTSPCTAIYTLDVVYHLTGTVASNVRITKNLVDGDNWDTKALAIGTVSVGKDYKVSRRLSMAANETLEFFGAYGSDRFDVTDADNRGVTVSVSIKKAEATTAQFDAVRDFSKTSSSSGNWHYVWDKYDAGRGTGAISPMSTYGTPTFPVGATFTAWYDQTTAAENTPCVSDTKYPGLLALHDGSSSDGWSVAKPVVQFVAPYTGYYSVLATYGLGVNSPDCSVAVSKNFDSWFMNLAVGDVTGANDYVYKNGMLYLTQGDTLDFRGAFGVPTDFDYISMWGGGDRWYDKEVTLDVKVDRVVPTPELTPSLKDALMLPDGADVMLDNVYLSRPFSDYIYVSSADGLTGIRVNTPPNWNWGEGFSMTIVGVMSHDPITNERVIDVTNGSAQGVWTSATIPVHFMTNKTLGGTANDLIGQPGISDGVGLNNIGLLIKTTGRVSNPSGSTTDFTLADGSGAKVNVKCIGATAPADNAYVSVIGIISLNASGERLVLINRDEDINTIQE
ncbi:MAG: hypothetical protein ABFD54_15490 [Armatimonadota bacterium]|nr:hypothetical protein [bacterium]